jgi:integrase
MQLTDIVVKQLIKAGRYTDDQTKGLHLWVKSQKQRYWILRFTYNGKRQNMSLGAYPEISLKLARHKAIKARNDINNAINPIEVKITANAPNEIESKKITFEEFATNYINTMRPRWGNEKHADQWLSTMKTYAFPEIGCLALDEIDTDHIYKILLGIWIKKPETASRVRGRIERILSSATVAKHRHGINPAQWKGHLEHLLPPTPKSTKHHEALPYKQITTFLASIREIDRVSALALEFTILNASRTGEVINAKREEVEGGIWTVPASRMKARKEHQVPLGVRSLELIEIAKSMDKDSPYLFSNNGRPLSNMAMLLLTRKYAPNKTVHGFRSTFRDWVAEETEHSPEVAEMALAHTISNQVEAAYRRGNLIERRRRLMNDWESYCLTGVWGNVLSFLDQKAA